jgi:hypothetical protein
MFDVLPEGAWKVVVGLFILCAIAGSLDWLIAHPAVLVLAFAGISGSIFFWVRQKRARNRV